MDSETPISRRPPVLQLFFLQGLAQRSDERLDAGEQAVAGRGQADAAAVCFGERSADFAFKGGEAFADGRLRDAQMGGGAGHAASGGEGDQGFDMGKHIYSFLEYNIVV